MRSAVFLDRDGTLIRDKGYISRISQVELYPYTIRSLRKLQKGFLLFIVTNQSGISKGVTALEDVNTVNAHLLKILKKSGIVITELYMCPHDKTDGCKCRKPGTYFVDKARRKYKLDLASSFVIGDHPSDVMLAVNSGAKGIFVLTGHGRHHREEVVQLKNKDISITVNLEKAVTRIAKQNRRLIV